MVNELPGSSSVKALDVPGRAAVYRELKTSPSGLSPEIRKGYQDVERIIGARFVVLYGECLRPGQRKYMERPHTLVLLRDDYKRLAGWPREIRRPNMDNLALNGRLYVGYKPKSHESNAADQAAPGQKDWIGGEMLTVGKLSVHVVKPELQDVAVSPEAMNRESYMHGGHIQRTSGTMSADPIAEAMKRFTAVIATNEFVGVTAHEKGHGVQDERNIPSPLREFHAYYIQWRMVRDLTDRVEPPLGPFAKVPQFWGSLVEKYDAIYGEGAVDKLMFGNLREPAFSQLLSQLKAEFTPEKLTEITPEIEWITQPIPQEENIA